MSRPCSCTSRRSKSCRLPSRDNRLTTTRRAGIIRASGTESRRSLAKDAPMRQRILALLAEGKTYSQIVAELGCAKSTISYHAKSVKPPPNYKVHDWAAVQKHYDEGHGVKECRRHFGICTNVWYNAVKAGKVVPRADYRIPIAVLLSPERNTARSHVRWRLIGDGILEEKCARCGISEWLGKPHCLCASTTLMASRQTIGWKTCKCFARIAIARPTISRAATRKRTKRNSAG